MNTTQISIIELAHEQFMRFGFKAVTMDEIARGAGISKKTLYENFADKDELVNAVLQYIDQQVDQQERIIIKQSDNAIVEVIRLIELFEDMLKTMNPNCIPDLQKYYPSCFKQWNNQFDEHCARIKRNLKRGIKEGYYRKNINIDLCAAIRVTDIMSLLMNPVPKGFNFYEMQNMTTEIFLYGISTLEGHAIVEKQIQLLKKNKR